MSRQYASQQPEGFKNHVENIAIVGAGGNVGSFIAKALITQGGFKVTAITRADSKSKLPDGLHAVKQVIYDDKATITEALKGQDVLIVTMGVQAPRQQTFNLVDAAVEAGVSYIMPNEWGGDHANLELGKDTMLGPAILEVRRYIEKVGGNKLHWIGLTCGFWYEFSLAGYEFRYGFNFKEKRVTFFNDGNQKILTSTWPQCGLAVAKILSLPIFPEKEGDEGMYLSDYNNNVVYISSFYISQKDMFDSVLRVTGDKESDWTISYEDVKERFKRGKELFAQGQLMGFGLFLYSRVFFPEGDSYYGDKLDNEKLGLPKEDLDEYTKIAVEMAKESGA